MGSQLTNHATYRPKSLWARVFISAGITAIATLLEYLLWPIISPAPYLLFYPALLAAALVGEGIVAIFISVIIVQCLFTRVGEPFRLQLPGDLIRQAIYISSALAISGLTTALRTAKDRAIAAASEEALARNSADTAMERSVAFAQRQEALASLGQSALSTGDISEFMHSTVNCLGEILGADTVSIFELSPHQDVLFLRAGTQIKSGDSPLPALPVNANNLIGYTLLSEAPVVMNDAADESRFLPKLPDAFHDGIESAMSVVIPGRGHPYGVLMIGTICQRRFSAQEVTFLLGASAILAAATERNQVENELAQILNREQIAREEAETVAAQLTIEKELREQFVNTLTHDLRNPLAAAKVSAQLIQRQPERMDRIPDLAARVTSSLNRADKLIQDLLDANRVKAGQKLSIQPVECDLVALVKDACEELAMVYGDRIKVQHGVDRLLGLWDCGELRRAVENLVINAFKYGYETTPVTIAVKSTAGQAMISVHNFGEPIRNEDQERLFDSFQRGQESHIRGKRGWGIGLTLVRGVVEAHHGRISIESRLDAGTRFTLILPIESAAAHKTA